MSISFIQQEALATNPDFKAQVDALVMQQALYKNDTMPDLDLQYRNILAQVTRTPDSYGFAKTIIAANTWNTTFDVWAADPKAAEGDITAAVDHNFNFLTGFNPPPPPEP